MEFLKTGGLTLLATAFLLNAQFTVPQLGVARFADGSVHLIRGVAANFIVDPKVLSTADSASFSSSAGLISTKGVIRLMKSDGTLLGEYQSTEEAPVLNIDAGLQTAVVWLPSLHLLLRWDGGKFTETTIDDSSFPGRVTSVNLPSATSARFFVTRADASVVRVAVSLPDGRATTLDIQPGAQNWAFAQQGWIVSEDSRGLVAEQANGNPQTIQLNSATLPAGDLSVERIADHWLHVWSHSLGTNWVVDLEATKISSYLLPPPPVTEAAR